jgi:hypothetical protein
LCYLLESLGITSYKLMKPVFYSTCGPVFAAELNGGTRFMATIEQKNASDLGEQAIALAEQLGRIAGTVQGTAESWLNDPNLTAQLTRVRDGATQMLQDLQAAASRGRNASKAKSAPAPARTRTISAADRAHAPGKKRRGPSPSMKGVKKSDESIPKSRTAQAVRQRRKSYA